MLRIGRVGLDMDVVAQRAVGAVEEFDDAKAFIDGIEEGAVALLAVGKRRLGAFQLGIVGDRELARSLAFSASSAAMRRLQFFDLDQTHGHPPGVTAKTAVGSGIWATLRNNKFQPAGKFPL